MHVGINEEYKILLVEYKSQISFSVVKKERGFGSEDLDLRSFYTKSSSCVCSMVVYNPCQLLSTCYLLFDGRNRAISLQSCWTGMLG